MAEVEPLCYVIMSENDLGETRYLGTDNDSGGYSYWSHTLSGARFFKNQGEVNQILISSDFQRDCEMAGEKRPPRMIDLGAGLCYEHPKGWVRIIVVPILKGTSTWDNTFQVKIKKKKKR